jgi:hypothetical protein
MYSTVPVPKIMHILLQLFPDKIMSQYPHTVPLMLDILYFSIKKAFHRVHFSVHVYWKIFRLGVGGGGKYEKGAVNSKEE